MPYLGSKDYIGVPFLKYPTSVGLNFLVENPDDEEDVHIDRTKLRVQKGSVTESFLQTWIFCALLHEILNNTFQGLTGGAALCNHEDFVITTSERPPGLILKPLDVPYYESSDSTYRIVTTAKFEELLEQWAMLIRPQLAHSEKQYFHLSERVLGTAREVLAVSEDSFHTLSIKQSVFSMLEMVSDCFRDLFSGSPYAQEYHDLGQSSYIWNERKADSMRALG